MKKKKILRGIIVALIIIVLLTPLPIRYKDGGTVKYQAILYSVTKWHAMMNDTTKSQSDILYYEGYEVKILGITVLDNAEVVEYRYCE